MENKKHETEEVLLAEVYLKDGDIGFRYTPDANTPELNYFLESFLRIQRKEYEQQFSPEGFEDRRGLE